MADNQLFSRINSSSLGQFSAFPGEMTEEEVMAERATPTTRSLSDIEKEIDKIDSALNAINSTVQAQGKNPNPALLERMSSLQAQKTSLQDLIKERPAPSAAAPTAEPGAKNLLDASVETIAPKTATSEAAKRPAPVGLTSSSAKSAGKVSTATGTQVPELEDLGLKPAMTLQERIAQSSEELKREKEAAGKEREEAMRRTEVGELASLVGRSLAQIGAASQGMRTGVDMSGVGQQALVDWEKKRERIDNTYQTKLASIAKEREQLLQQQQDALKSENDAKLLGLKEKEYKLAERETAAKIAKYNADIAATRAAAGKPDSAMAKTALERATKNIDELDKTFIKTAKLNSKTNEAVTRILENRKAGKSTAADERLIITTYLKGLDPESAVLAAEQLAFIDAGNRESFINALTSKEDGALSNFFTNTILNRMDENKLAGLKESVDSNFKTEEAAYREQVRKQLRSAYESGVTNPQSILGRDPRPEELDEVTSKTWGVALPTPARPETKAVQSEQPTSRVPGVKKSRAADLK